MKTKEENKKIKTKIVIIFLGIFLSFILFVINNSTNNKVAYASISQINENVEISNATKINIEEVINQNIKMEITENILTETIELEYITEYIENSNLPTGTIQVSQEGRTGIEQITIKTKSENGIETFEEQLNSNIIKAPINKIVQIGTGKGKVKKHIVKQGETVYVTSDRLSVLLECNTESQKVGTLKKDDSALVLEVLENWYKIKTERVTGWVKSECTTYINPNKPQEESNIKEESASDLLKRLNFKMALNEPSGLSLEQFKKVLSDNKDKNNIFEDNAEYFYYIEEQYGINGIFVAAVGIHESAWGTSKLAKNKYNLFGYGASDSNPYNNAYSFDNYSEAIDLIARVFTKYYLNPKGTSIYGGEIANGKYYNGNTLSCVNKKYASDKNWANAVYSHMKYLYNKL